MRQVDLLSSVKGCSHSTIATVIFFSQPMSCMEFTFVAPYERLHMNAYMWKLLYNPFVGIKIAVSIAPCEQPLKNVNHSVNFLVLIIHKQTHVFFFG